MKQVYHLEYNVIRFLNRTYFNFSTTTKSVLAKHKHHNRRGLACSSLRVLEEQNQNAVQIKKTSHNVELM